MENYVPPFSITQEMLTRVSNISLKISKLDNYSNLNKKPYLRKQTKINSIHSSLAIENNNLTLEQVKDVIDGKLVIGPQKDIQEVMHYYKDVFESEEPGSIIEKSENARKKYSKNKLVNEIADFLNRDTSRRFCSAREN